MMSTCSEAAITGGVSKLSMNEKTVTVCSSDGVKFEIRESVAVQCSTIKHMIEDGCADSTIPLPNVDSHTLTKVIHYCTKHANGEATEEELDKFDEEFSKLDQAELYDLLLAANYLDIEDLLDLMAQTTVDMMSGKDPEEIRQMFGIKNTFTKEEQEEIEREMALIKG